MAGIAVKAVTVKMVQLVTPVMVSAFALLDIMAIRYSYLIRRQPSKYLDYFYIYYLCFKIVNKWFLQ